MKKFNSVSFALAMLSLVSNSLPAFAEPVAYEGGVQLTAGNEVAGAELKMEGSRLDGGNATNWLVKAEAGLVTPISDPSGSLVRPVGQLGIVRDSLAYAGGPGVFTPLLNDIAKGVIMGDPAYVMSDGSYLSFTWPLLAFLQPGSSGEDYMFGITPKVGMVYDLSKDTERGEPTNTVLGGQFFFEGQVGEHMRVGLLAQAMGAFESEESGSPAGFYGTLKPSVSVKLHKNIAITADGQATIAPGDGNTPAIIGSLGAAGAF